MARAQPQSTTLGKLHFIYLANPQLITIVANLTRCETIWFEDGNVVLVAGDTAFKVHRSMLARNSGVFQDLFTVPQPECADHMDGCPVVQMSDRSDEMAILLDLFYNGMRCADSSCPTLNFSNPRADIRDTLSTHLGASSAQCYD